MGKKDKKDGTTALRIARKAIELWVKKGEKLNPNPKDYPQNFNENSGVFVTLFTYPEKQLRGCIGYPEPVLPLIKALIDSAINAAARDPRFAPVKPHELNRITVEVSILTNPEPIEVRDTKDYPKKVSLGRDGLVIELGHSKGLLLPEVATEHGMDAKDFLAQTCLKAGLPPTAWMEKEINGNEVKVYRFQTQKFREGEPGKV